MIKRFMVAAILFFAMSLQADIRVDTTRETVFHFACMDENYNILSQHFSRGEANVSCTTRKLNDLDGLYYVQGGRWRIDVTGAMAQSYLGIGATLPVDEEPPSFIRTWTNAVPNDPETGLAVDGWAVVVQLEGGPPTVHLDKTIPVGTTTYNFTAVEGIQTAINPRWRVYPLINGVAGAPAPWTNF
jgi:hypothetical protein